MERIFTCDRIGAIAFHAMFVTYCRQFLAHRTPVLLLDDTIEMDPRDDRATHNNCLLMLAEQLWPGILILMTFELAELCSIQVISRLGAKTPIPQLQTL